AASTTARGHPAAGGGVGWSRGPGASAGTAAAWLNRTDQAQIRHSLPALACTLSPAMRSDVRGKGTAGPFADPLRACLRAGGDGRLRAAAGPAGAGEHLA